VRRGAVAVAVALAVLATQAGAQPIEPPSEAPIEAPIEPPIERPIEPPSPPAFVTPPAPPIEGQAPSCVPGPRWYVETSLFVGSIRYRTDLIDPTQMTDRTAGTRVALSAATGLLYRACTGAGTPGMHVRLGAYFEVREQLPIGAEAQVDWPSGGYRLGGRLATVKSVDNYPYAPWEIAVGFRARRGILLFGIDGVYARYANDYSEGVSYGVLVGIGIQARPDAD